jgi:hypothetical protein
MKKSSTLFLQVVVGLIGVAALALLLLEPRHEGVNAHATNFQIYSDPFVILVYIGAVPFFLALYQTIKLLGCARRNQMFSSQAVKALKAIKYCALAVIGFVAAEEIYIMLAHGDDDATGGIMMGVFIAFGSVIVLAAAAVFQRILQKAVDLKSENDLTI